MTAYFTLGMWLWPEHGYEEVLRQFTDGLAWAGADEDELDPAAGDVPWSGSITKARQRLGAAPLKVLFEQARGPVGGPDTPGVWWRGRRLTAIDGFTLDLPDSPANRTEFGGPTDGAFPQVRCVAHAEVGTRALIDAAFGPYSVGEQTLTRNLIGSLGPDMLVICDRNFPSYELWAQMAATGADLLMRMPATFALPVRTVLADGSYLSQLQMRGKSPIAVRQEVWALLYVYQALCELITDAAARHRVDPDQISFTRARNLARRSINWIDAAFSP